LRNDQWLGLICRFLIATDDHAPDLDRCFAALINQSLPSAEYEVIVIEAAGTHDCAPVWQRALERMDARLPFHLESLPRSGRAMALNRGLAFCRAPIILFFASDALASPRTAEAHLHLHEANPERHHVGIGATLLAEEFRTHFTLWLEESVELFGARFHHQMSAVPTNFFYVGNASVKRDCCGTPALSTSGFAIMPGTISSWACDCASSA
jgi:glycosyltransferase involved in cell wall biosynthesis